MMEPLEALAQEQGMRLPVTEGNLGENITPISVLPIDIIQEIILHASDSSQLAIPVDTRAAPWSYGQVCSLWRTATLSLPPLWANISVYLCWCEAKDVEPSNEILFRSKQSPLNVTFRCDTISNELYFDGSSSEIVEALVSQSDRWTELTFIGPFPTSFTRLLAENIKPSLLTSIAVYNPECQVPGWTGGTSLIPALQSISRSRLLHKVEMHPLSIHIDEWRKLKPHPLPWSQITHFKLESGPGEGPVEHALFHLMPNLLQYDNSLTYYGRNVAPTATYQLLRHHKLTYLELREQPWPWLDHVAFPSLKHLSWRVYDQMESKDEGKGVGAICSLIGRSDCCLESLHLIDFHHAALPILDAVPSLRKLRVSRSAFSKLLVEQLRINDELSLGKLPALKELSFEEITMFTPRVGGENIFHALIPMLQGRRQANVEYCFLERFSLSATTLAEHFADEDQCEKLNEIHDGGLDMSISVRTRDLSALDIDSFFELEEEERMNKKILAGTHKRIFVPSCPGASDWQKGIRRIKRCHCDDHSGSDCVRSDDCQCEPPSDSDWESASEACTSVASDSGYGYR